MGYVYDRETDDYKYVDSGDDPKSPMEQAFASGGQDSADRLARAAGEYYAGSQDPNARKVGPNYFVNGRDNIDEHPSVNWYDPTSYQYLINTPGSGPTTPVAPRTPTPPPPDDRRPSSPSGYGGGGYGGPWAPDLSYWENAPQFNYDFKPFDNPTPFTYGDYTQPTLDDAKNEPGYAFARDEGLHGLTASRAAQGIVRSGGTLKDLMSWGNRFAEQNYANVDARQRANYSLNRGNAKDIYDTNLGNLMSIYRDNETRRFDVAKAEYEPQLTSWSGKMGAYGNASTAAFNRAWDAYKFASDDAFRHWQTIYNGGLETPPPA